MKVERAVEALRRLLAERRKRLKEELATLRRYRKSSGKVFRQQARAAKGTEQVRAVQAAQKNEDAARDVGKLLALLDAIETEKKPATTGEETK